MSKPIVVDKQRFLVDISPDTNLPYIVSIHPYDETEYHWARQLKNGNWLVVLNGKWIVILSPMTERDVAAELLALDRKAHLSRTGGIF